MGILEDIHGNTNESVTALKKISSNTDKSVDVLENQLTTELLTAILKKLDDILEEVRRNSFSGISKQDTSR